MLYLPVLGLALLLGLLVAGVPEGWRRWSLATGLVLFELTMLLHNETIWRRVARVSQQACRAAGEELRKEPETVFRGLPPTREGVFFLANGFPYCVEMNSGVKAERVRWIADNARAAKGERVLTWSDEEAKFLESGAPK